MHKNDEVILILRRSSTKWMSRVVIEAFPREMVDLWWR